MADLPFTVADVGVLVVLLVPALLAFAVGFIREALLVAGWIGAILAVFYLFPVLQPFVRDLVPVDFVADAVTVIVIFLVALVAISVAGYVVTKPLRGSSLNVIDRVLGFLFGLLQGAVVVCVAWLVFEKFVPAADHPDWIREATSRPAVEAGANLLVGLAPDTGWDFGVDLGEGDAE